MLKMVVRRDSEFGNGLRLSNAGKGDRAKLGVRCPRRSGNGEHQGASAKETVALRSINKKREIKKKRKGPQGLET